MNSSVLPEILTTIPGSKAVNGDSNVKKEDKRGDANKKKPHLVLHFDINETILIGDEAGGDTREDCLNKILAKSAFVKIPTPVPAASHHDDNDSAPDNNNQSYDVTKKITPICWWDGSPIGDSMKEETKTATGSDKSSDPDTPITPPPLYIGWEWPKQTVPYYRTSFKKRAKTFTEHEGAIYRPLFEKLQDHLTLKSETDNINCIPKHHPFHHMIPSFFHTLTMLQKEEQPYTLVLRTFGSDLEDIVMALNDFAMGKHPMFPDFREPNLILEQTNKEDKSAGTSSTKAMFRGRWRKQRMGETKNMVYDLFPWDTNHDDDNTSSETSSATATNNIVSGDEQVLDVIENCTICGVQDDYEFWSANNCAPWAGKPVWIRNKNLQTKEQHYHHIFFDDNIHNDPTDSIVSVRIEEGDTDGNNSGSQVTSFLSLNGEETLNQQGKHIFRVPTIAAVLEKDWFWKKIHESIENQ